MIDKNKCLGYYNYCQQQNRAKRFKRCANSFLLDSINQIHATALSHCRSEISLVLILHIFRKKVKFQAFSAIKIPNFYNQIVENNIIGHLLNGKALHFDCEIYQFESDMPCYTQNHTRFV